MDTAYFKLRHIFTKIFLLSIVLNTPFSIDATVISIWNQHIMSNEMQTSTWYMFIKYRVSDIKIGSRKRKANYPCQLKFKNVFGWKRDEMNTGSLWSREYPSETLINWNLAKCRFRITNLLIVQSFRNFAQIGLLKRILWTKKFREIWD